VATRQETSLLDACVDLGCHPDMVAVARRFVDHTLRLWEVDDAHIDEAVLLASELISNAVLHARTDVRLTVRSQEDGTLRIEAADENPRLPISVAPQDDAQSGRGLWLVETVASAWGVERTGEGKTVWFELGAYRPEGRDDPCLDVTSAESVDEALDRIEAAAGELPASASDEDRASSE
jgi:anti-sigma regulatory factor (Ser/Thr protein kinase)